MLFTENNYFKNNGNHSVLKKIVFLIKQNELESVFPTLTIVPTKNLFIYCSNQLFR